MCLGSVCDSIFELSPFALRGSILVELQTLETVPQIQSKMYQRSCFQLCRVDLGWAGYVLPSGVDADELEPLLV